MEYVELHARSAFSFLRGASLPEQLAEGAARLNLPAIALCDRDGVYGAPRLFSRAKETGVRPMVGAELTMEDGSILPVLVESRRGYQNLCRLLTRAHLRSGKGKASARWDELPEFAEGLVALTGDEEGPLLRAIARAAAAPRGGSKQTLTPALSLSEREREKRIQRRNETAECDGCGNDGGGKSRVVQTSEAREREFPLPRRGGEGEGEGAAGVVEKLLNVFGPGNLFIEIQRHLLRGEERVNRALRDLAGQFHLPLLATNGVLYSTDSERPLLDVFTCIRHHTHLDAAGKLLSLNSERCLKSAEQMRGLFRDCPEAIRNGARLAERLEFTLENLGYEFPSFPVSPEHTMDSWLRDRAFAGARWRYGEVPAKVRGQLETELALIQKLKVAGYFLIVRDMVEFCRQNDIMAQGRGSAANSTVCFCLGITAVDPLRFNTLFERFLTEGRKNSWPDIDIDLPSGDRRERVIQEIYRRHGQHGAAMTANVITFRGRSAAREVGKALNLSASVLNRFSSLYASGDFPHTLEWDAQMAKAGLPREHPRAPAFAALCRAVHGLPRHLGQHSGGMIISRGTLDSIVPLENASMPNRVVAQWDKDDCEDLGIIKVDFLGLGMMSVLQDAVKLTQTLGRPVDLAHLPENDAKTFAMMRNADTIGVFQIESRAQMATLPRMKPETFYDLVIEVAIIRPGPIHGGLTHPYLDRRAGRAPVEYDHEDLKPVLKRTLGVPLFQEQMLQLAMILADFSGAEAEELRRALSFHRSEEKMQRVEKKMRAAMARKGHSPELIDKVAATIGSFALYGFPESHAISFAHLAYASGYLKAHRAPEFYASLLNNQPMGFYSSATLIKDGQRHGVEFCPVCVLRSEWDCTIDSDFAIRLGLRVVRGLSGSGAERLLAERRRKPFASLEDFKRRVRLNKDELRTLAEVGALNGFVSHRRDALWEVEKEIHEQDLFEQAAARAACSPADMSSSSSKTMQGSGAMESWSDEGMGDAKRQPSSQDSNTPAPQPANTPSLQQPAGVSRTRTRTRTRTNSSHAPPTSNSPLAPMNYAERIRADFNGMHLTIGSHPMALLRAHLPGVWRASDLPRAKHGSRVRIAGNVICRQRPGTAHGFVFLSLEDETGVSNAIITPPLFEAQRLLITGESFLLIEGKVQNVDGVVHVKAERVERLPHDAFTGAQAHDFH